MKKQNIITSSALLGSLALLSTGALAEGSINGLKAEYFNNRYLSGVPVLKRTDATVAFNWGTSSPGKSVPADKFSVRWSGKVEAPVDGDYTFTTLSDDGARLWVDGRPIINNWTTHTSQWDNGATIRLRAGRRYDIKLEYFEKAEGAVIGLYWKYPGLTKATLIPTEYLFHSVGAAENTVETVQLSGDFTAPANLRVKGLWLAAEKRKTDQLFWDPVPGAVAYNVYQYDLRIGAGVTGTNFIVPASLFCAMTYSVTAIDSQGNESIPSNIAGAVGAASPTKILTAVTMIPPTSPRAVPDWNAGRSRIVLSWLGSKTSWTYNVYRDGKLVATGLWGLVYIDTNVRPGETHSYYVKGVTAPWVAPAESEPTATVTAAAPAGPPNLNGRVNIVSVVPNDDSVIINFTEVEKAVDYRAYNVAKPGSYKYSGGGLSIEMNGMEPGKKVEIVVEAVDKLGPFQKLDGFYGPGAMDHNGVLKLATNGQGDPSNVPNVLARSDVFVVTPQAVNLKGRQVFFDTFRNNQPFVQSQTLDQRIIDANPGGGGNTAKNSAVRELQNDKWVIRNYAGDMDNTRVFVMSNHIMETLYDGGTARTGVPMHNNNATLAMMPKAFADISGGKVLHVTFEVDPYFTGRRWCEVFIAEAGDPLLRPGKFEAANQPPTATGKMLKWEILQGTHNTELFLGLNANKELIVHKLNSGGERRRAIGSVPGLNGTPKDIDRRHRFDMYLSQNRVQIFEEGKMVTNTVMPQGVTLPFTKVNVYFVHQVYHTNNERPGQILIRDGAYFSNHRPFADERHWDNMGFEVLDGFPK